LQPVPVSAVSCIQAVHLCGTQAAASAFDERENRARKATISLCSTRAEGRKEKRMWQHSPRRQGRGKDVWWILMQPGKGIQHVGGQQVSEDKEGGRSVAAFENVLKFRFCCCF